VRGRVVVSDHAQVSVPRALGVTLAVAFVCALLVSTISVGLRPLQKANVEAERRAQLEIVINALTDIGQVHSIEHLEAHIVELASGHYDNTQDLATFNAESAIGKPGNSVLIPADIDLAGIKRRALFAKVYLVRGSGGEVEFIILPVWGRGYQSTLRAWLVLDGDTRSIRALKFYQHGETPGIGARIQEPEWEALWHGVPIYDASGVLRIGVRTQAGGASADDAVYKVDGISGATRTNQGVDGLIRFWLGDFGFGPYLRRIREE
jgi:Na+-transporting NADH:ubiquinone oxidoreductase subunit C